MAIGDSTIEQAIKDLEILKEKVSDLYFEVDRMSSSGKKTLDDIAKLAGVPTEEEVKKMLEDNNDR
tara:strand:- start:764 stop:961 length:198 start_codon:yes stop_codon:yes gene_type:complete